MVRKCQRCDFLAPPEHQIVGKEDDSLRTRAFGVIEGRREVLRALHLPGENLDPPSLRRLPDGVEDGSVLGKRSAPDYGDTPRAWKGIEQQLQPFTAQCCLAVGDAREIAAGPGKVRNDSLPHRVSDESEDNGRYDTGLFQRADGW